MYQLEFTRFHDYSGDDESVVIPVVLGSGVNRIPVAATVDTGASFCLFGAEIAEVGGRELTSGTLMRFRTANSGFEAYGHEVQLTAFGVATFAMVYFFADPPDRQKCVGKNGWLDQVRLGLTTAPEM